MTDRERLVKILCEGECQGEENQLICPERRNGQCKSIRKLEMCQVNSLADTILADGWIRPPCKVGDTVYAIGDKDGHQIKECRAEEFFFVDAEKFQVGVYFECDTDCDGCYFSSWSQSHCGEWSCDGEYGNGFMPVDDFGKTVFLTREEAEKALSEREDGTDAGNS